jgi:hypothetical protein
MQRGEARGADAARAVGVGGHVRLLERVLAPRARPSRRRPALDLVGRGSRSRAQLQQGCSSTAAAASARRCEPQRQPCGTRAFKRWTSGLEPAAQAAARAETLRTQQSAAAPLRVPVAHTSR